MTPTETQALARKAFAAYQTGTDAGVDLVDIIAREIEAVIRRAYGLPDGDIAIHEDFGLTDAIAVAFIAGQMQAGAGE